MLRFSSKHGLLFYPSKDEVLPKKYKIIHTDSYLTEVPFIVPKEKENTYNAYCQEMLEAEEHFKSLILENV